MKPKRPGVPRSFLKTPRDFASHATRDWHQPETVDELLGLRAAEAQHIFAMHVRRILLSHPIGSQRGLARATGINYKRFNKGLHGHFCFTTLDLACIEAVLGKVLAADKIPWMAVEDEALARMFPAAPWSANPHRPR